MIHYTLDFIILCFHDGIMYTMLGRCIAVLLCHFIYLFLSGGVTIVYWMKAVWKGGEEGRKGSVLNQKVDKLEWSIDLYGPFPYRRITHVRDKIVPFKCEPDCNNLPCLNMPSNPPPSLSQTHNILTRWLLELWYGIFFLCFSNVSSHCCMVITPNRQIAWNNSSTSNTKMIKNNFSRG